MDLVTSSVSDGWRELKAFKGDRTTRTWFPVNLMWAPFVMTALYVAFVLIGPRLIKKPVAGRIHQVMLVYNSTMAIFSAYIFGGFLITSIKAGLWSTAFQYHLQEEFYDGAYYGWLYYITKYVELTDTVFMVLRKKDSQVSFLHVYHHSFLIFLSHFVMWFNPSHRSLLIPMNNLFIHMLMYSYYALSTIQSVKPYLWWKKYLTQLQMTQFVIMMVYSFHGIFTAYSSRADSIMHAVQFVFAVQLYVLFNNFYKKAYRDKKAAAAAASKKNDDAQNNHTKTSNNHTNGHAANGYHLRSRNK